MNKKILKETIANWSLPLLTFFIVMVALTIRFLVSTSQTEQAEVEKYLTDTLGGYAEEITRKIAILEGEGALAAEFDSCITQIDTDLSEVLLSCTSQVADTYMTMLCGRTGTAIYQLAGEDEIYSTETGQLDYYWDIFGGGKRILFLDDDGIIGERAVAVVTPVVLNNVEFKYLIQYVKVSSFEDIFANYDLGGENTVLLVNSKKKVLLMSDRQAAGRPATESEDTAVSDLENWLCKKRGIAQADVKVLEKRMEDEKTGVLYVADEHKEIALVYTPIGVGGGYLITILDNAYVDKQVEYHWKPMQSMAIQSGIAMLAFLAIVIGVTIATYWRNNQTKEELSVKAETDLLTDLNNKLATENKIRKYMLDHPGQQAMMFVLDIDNFKKINDTMGHTFGDQVLRELGRNLPAQFRATDIIGRTGGDEFTLFLKDIRDDEAIRKEAEKLLLFFQNFQAGGYVKYSATASIGVAVYPRDGKDFETLYKAADNALYVAKRRGKNQLAFYGESHDEMDLEKNLQVDTEQNSDGQNV